MFTVHASRCHHDHYACLLASALNQLNPPQMYHQLDLHESMSMLSYFFGLCLLILASTTIHAFVPSSPAPSVPSSSPPSSILLTNTQMLGRRRARMPVQVIMHFLSGTRSPALSVLTCHLPFLLPFLVAGQKEGRRGRSSELEWELVERVYKGTRNCSINLRS